jgi:hypothetical protein
MDIIPSVWLGPERSQSLPSKAPERRRGNIVVKLGIMLALVEILRRRR